MRIIVLTSDNYIKSVRPFAWLFNRYFGHAWDVMVAGYSPPAFDLPGNFYFHSIGRQEDYPLDRWSDGLIALLQDLDDEAFLLFLEDMWITRPVNVQAMQMLYDYMLQFRNVLKLDTGTDRLYAANSRDYNNCGYIDLIRSDPASQYQMSLMVGLWRRELMLRFLKPNEDPWQTELQGTPRVAAAAPDVMVLGTRQYPLRHTLAHRRGDPGELLLDDLKPEDVRALEEEGYI